MRLAACGDHRSGKQRPPAMGMLDGSGESAMCNQQQAASEEPYRRMRGLVPLYEGFLTYGGRSVRETEALTV